MKDVSLEEKEGVAIERIHKFAKIADAMRFDVCVGFSGGKDSQVVYDLMKRSCVPFKAYYNKAFESNITKNFIRFSSRKPKSQEHKYKLVREKYDKMKQNNK